jgi:hypothetical protein
MSDKIGKLASEKVSRRFVLQLQAYFKNQDLSHAEFLSLIGISCYTWHVWTHGIVKRIRTHNINKVAKCLHMDMSSIFGLVPQRGEGRFTRFVELNELYTGLLQKGDNRALMQLVRKAALTCYDVMVDEKLPVVMSISNIANKDVISDDHIVLDVVHNNKTYRIQIVPGLQISYCFGVVSSVLGQKILHEGVISMSIMVVICDYIRSKLTEPEKDNPEDGAYFLNFSREFSKKISAEQ